MNFNDHCPFFIIASYYYAV